MNRRIVLTVNAAWNIATFRAGLIRSLIAAGYEVVAVAPRDRHVPRITQLSARFIDLPMESGGTHPLRDLQLLYRYWSLLRGERPAVVLAYTIKPNIYGTLAASALRIPVINNIAGLGTTFLRSGWLNWTARVLYRIALSQSRLVFFQNKEDLNLFVSLGLVRADRAKRLPGSGVDIDRFAPMPARSRNGRPFRFLLLGRLLWDKGVGEYVEAFRLLRNTGANAEALLLGFVDSKNPSAISQRTIDDWVTEGLVNYLGEADDVRRFIAESDCVVLPSYREGTPRALLEAASMEKPIITTNAPGCRDVVSDGISGYLVPPKDVKRLYDAMASALALTDSQLRAMGKEGRRLVTARFQESAVIAEYQNALAHLLPPAPGKP